MEEQKDTKTESETEGGKRSAPDEVTIGESPEAKKMIASGRMRLEMPSDDAPALDWYKTLFMKMEEMSDTCNDLRKSLEFSQVKLTECRKDITEMQEEIDDLKRTVNVLQCDKRDLSLQCKLLAESNIKTEIRLREQNLVFEGLKETHGETDNLLYRKVVDVLNYMAVFNGCGSKVPINRIHRTGPFIRDQCRPVVCHFAKYDDVQLIMKNRMQLPHLVFVREDFPEEIENRRRVLRPIFNKARKSEKYRGKCRLMYDKLIIHGKAYTVAPKNNLNTLPLDLQPRVAAERQNENTIVFFTLSSPFSNFHDAPFFRDNNRYFCNEQYIQAKKAELFCDDETQQKIMVSSNPYEIKRLGGKVKNFVQQRWELAAKKIVTEACLCKFTQNAELYHELTNTGSKIIGEASKDLFWGIGKSLDDLTVLDNTDWPGENTLGNVLMDIREQLK